MEPARNCPEARDAGGVSADAAIGAASASAIPSEPVAAIATTVMTVVLLAERWMLFPVVGLLWLNTASTFLILLQERGSNKTGSASTPQLGLLRRATEPDLMLRYALGGAGFTWLVVMLLCTSKGRLVPACKKRRRGTPPMTRLGQNLFCDRACRTLKPVVEICQAFACPKSDHVKVAQVSVSLGRWLNW
jgi:hypothetical protein